MKRLNTYDNVIIETLKSSKLPLSDRAAENLLDEHISFEVGYRMLASTITELEKENIHLKQRIAEFEAKIKKCATCEDFHLQRYREGGEIIESQFGWCEKHGIAVKKSSGCIG